MSSANFCFANNTDFLPGDSFFFVRLTSLELEQLARQDSPVVSYGNHWDGGRGCGTFGYRKLRLLSMSATEKSSLREAFCLLQADLDEKFISNESEETAPAINVLVYNADYDWKRFGIGLQYNEKWPEETIAAGVTRREHMVLESFIPTDDGHVAQLLERNWRDSSIVRKLDVDCPERDDKSFNSNEPVEMRGKRIFVVLPNRKFSDYFHPVDGTRFCVIANGRMEQLVFNKQSWNVK